MRKKYCKKKNPLVMTVEGTQVCMLLLWPRLPIACDIPCMLASISYKLLTSLITLVMISTGRWMYFLCYRRCVEILQIEYNFILHYPSCFASYYNIFVLYSSLSFLFAFWNRTWSYILQVYTVTSSHVLCIVMDNPSHFLFCFVHENELWSIVVIIFLSRWHDPLVSSS